VCFASWIGKLLGGIIDSAELLLCSFSLCTLPTATLSRDGVGDGHESEGEERRVCKRQNNRVFFESKGGGVGKREFGKRRTRTVLTISTYRFGNSLELDIFSFFGTFLLFAFERQRVDAANSFWQLGWSIVAAVSLCGSVGEAVDCRPPTRVRKVFLRVVFGMCFWGENVREGPLPGILPPKALPRTTRRRNFSAHYLALLFMQLKEKVCEHDFLPWSPRIRSDLPNSIAKLKFNQKHLKNLKQTIFVSLWVLFEANHNDACVAT